MTAVPLRPDSMPRTLAERILSKMKRVIRDRRRRSIREVALALPPSRPVDHPASWSVHMLVCRRDLDMAIIAAKSLNLAADRAMSWVFHEDGSLFPADRSRLLTEFPGSTVVTREESDRHMAERLRAWPLLIDYRRKYVMMLKLLDLPEWSVGRRLISMDSDILFFERPDALLAAAENPAEPNAFNRDIETTYVRPLDRLGDIVGRPVLPRVNAGLAAIERDGIDYPRIDAWLRALTSDGPIHPHRIEQTLHAMIASASDAGAAHLPTSYDVAFGKDVRTSVCKHYVGWIRYGFEYEGLVYLLEGRDFARRWCRFAGGGHAFPT